MLDLELGFDGETGNFLSCIKRSWGIAFFGAGLFRASLGFACKIPIIGPFSLKKRLAMSGGEYTVLALLLIALLVGLLAHAFGFHPAVGAYMPCLIIRQEYFANEVQKIDHQQRHQTSTHHIKRLKTSSIDDR